MRVLVIGSTGYIGNRLVGALLERDDTVIAAARDPQKLDVFWWSDRVERRDIDVTDAESVAAGVTSDLDAVVYLVHGMAADDFVDTDARAAEHMRDAVTAAGVERVVYLSGIIPPVAEDELSDHLTSRLQVERLLSESTARVITLRAALIIGQGSTSFELMSQLSERMPVTVVPDWMNSLVEPVAVTDVVAALIGALDSDLSTTHLDVGGGEPLAYPDLIARVAGLRGTERPQLSVPGLPTALVSRVASWIADVPGPTVQALMESLREDMVAADSRWRDLPGVGAPLALDAAVERAIAAVDALERPSRRDPLGALPGDPDWAGAVDA